MTHEAESELIEELLGGCCCDFSQWGSCNSKTMELAASRIQELEAELAETKKTLASMSQAGGSLRDYREWRDEMRQFAQLSGVHAGTHVIVPVEPTEEILFALYGSYLSDETSKENCRDAFKAMLLAGKETGK